MSTQDIIDFCATTAQKGSQDPTQCFSVRSAFPSMGDLNRTKVYFRVDKNLKDIIFIIGIHACVRRPRIGKNHVIAYFLNEEVAERAKNQAKKSKIISFDPPSLPFFEDLSLSELAENKVFKAPGKDTFFYGRKGLNVYVLFRQSGQTLEEYESAYKMLQIALDGEIINESFLSGKPRESGERTYLTNFQIARRILEKRVGFVAAKKQAKPVNKLPSSFGDIFNV